MKSFHIDRQKLLADLRFKLRLKSELAETHEADGVTWFKSRDSAAHLGIVDDSDRIYKIFVASEVWEPDFEAFKKLVWSVVRVLEPKETLDIVTSHSEKTSSFSAEITRADGPFFSLRHEDRA